jgi:hypothetical protein
MMDDEEKRRAAVWVLNLHRECSAEAAKDSWLDEPGNASRRLLHKLATYAGWLPDGIYGECRDDGADADDGSAG